MKKENLIVVEAVQEMDSVVGSIGVHAEVLHDISTKFMSVVGEMNEAVYRGTHEECYREHHHELRLLAELLNYCMNDVAKDHTDISALKKTLFQEVVKKGAK